MNDFKAAIFDLDGTLLDSMDVWERVDVQFLAKRSLAVPAGYGDALCALSFREAARYTIDFFELSAAVDDVMDEWNAMALFEYSHNVGLKKNAESYLLALKARGIKLAVATSLPEALYTPALKNNGIYDLFSTLCSTGEVSRGKDRPDIYLLAADRLGVCAKDCVVFEDIAPAVLSAKSCGMRVYGMYDRYCAQSGEELMKIADGYLYDWADAPLPFTHLNK